MSKDDGLCWILRTKVSKVTHDKILEVANRETRGNISEAIRDMIKAQLKLYLENVDRTTLSLELRRILYEENYERRKKTKANLQKMYPDPQQSR